MRFLQNEFTFSAKREYGYYEVVKRRNVFALISAFYFVGLIPPWMPPGTFEASVFLFTTIITIVEVLVFWMWAEAMKFSHKSTWVTTVVILCMPTAVSTLSLFVNY